MKLSEAVKMLADAGIENAKTDAAVMFMHYLGKSRGELLLENTDSTDAALLDALARRAKREPLQYIIGSVDFYRESYKVTPDCLIPRPDTEHLVDYAVKNIPSKKEFIDLCTGSGCVGISILKNTADTSATLVDISPKALDITKENAERNGVAKRASFKLCDALEKRICEKVFAVVSNPPYITERAYSELEAELYFEPKLALVGGGDDGAEFYERLTELYRDVIEDEGFIAYEIGYDQSAALARVAEKHNMTLEIIKDYSGNCRVAVLRKK